MKKEKNHKLYRKMGFYERYIKRAIDIFCSGLAIIVFCWLYAIIALLVRIKLGSPVLFTQYRPGLIDPKTGKERIFKMYKFRTMTDKKDAEGNLLPDEVRLTKFGAWLRSTSLDELPEAFCILNGTMTLIGPRPQLVRDMVFMSEEQRMRHTAKPGLSGLAQVSGRNAISWDRKLQYDLEYGEYLRSAEITEEANYNMIDGLRNNSAPKDKKKRPKESVLAKLNEKKEEVAKRSGQKAMQQIMGQDVERTKK